MVPGSPRKYFDAETQFRRALQASPGQPLASVGLIHAQLGAGLLRSAGMNLRELLEKHPELISARYDARLLPDRERLEAVRKDLEAMARGSAQSDAGLLLAYLGHQLSQSELVQYGLDLEQVSNVRDPLVLLLRRAWLRPAGAAAQLGAATQPARAADSEAAGSAGGGETSR